VNERTDREVDFDKTVRGHETSSGEYVMVEPEEFAS
jgi:non-homologous end joining protein Ku